MFHDLPRARFLISTIVLIAIILSTLVYGAALLKENDQVTEYVDLAARQRTLSQRIAFSASELAAGGERSRIEQLRAELTQTRAEMERTHIKLTTGIPEGGNKPLMVGSLRELYFAPPVELDTKIGMFLELVDRFAARLDAELPPSAQAAPMSETLDGKAEVLLRMTAGQLFEAQGAVIAEYVRVLRSNRAFISKMGLVSFILILAVVLFQFLSLVRPALRTMRGEIKSLEAEQERTAEHARLKSEFLATMSHEIRTPMNGILGMAELIMSQRPPKQIETYARTIIHSGETLLRILNDVLDFSKIEAGRLEIDPTSFSLRELVFEEVALFNVPAREKGIEIAVHYQPGIEEQLVGDPLRLRQVLGNLIGNAIKFTEKGFVKVAVEKPAAQSSEDRLSLLIKVVDTGIGMSEAAQERIFDKFSQADGSTTRLFGGTGLGLAISKQLIELMGGRISVDSEPGRGSTFCLQMDFEGDAAVTDDEGPVPDLAGLRVLVVDDIPAVQESCASILQFHGLLCDASGSGQDALRMMVDAHERGTPYDVVLTDLLMPGMNGEALARSIFDYPELKGTCVVLMTSAGAPFSDEKLSRKGFHALVEKPIRERELMGVLQAAWRTHRTGAEPIFVRAPQETSAKVRADEAAIVLPGHRMLVAEDNVVNQIFIHEILEEMEVETVLVANGRDAVEAVANSAPFDLVLMDCQMPEMDGYAATALLCEMKDKGEAPARMPIVALTANALREDRQRCIDAGMDEYLTKPVRKLALKMVVYRMITGHSIDQVSDEAASQPERALSAGSGSGAPAAPQTLSPAERRVALSREDSADRAAAADPAVAPPSAAVHPGRPAAPPQGEAPLIDEEVVAQARALLKTKYDDMIKVFWPMPPPALMRCAAPSRKTPQATSPVQRTR